MTTAIAEKNDHRIIIGLTFTEGFDNLLIKGPDSTSPDVSFFLVHLYNLWLIILFNDSRRNHFVNFGDLNLSFDDFMIQQSVKLSILMLQTLRKSVSFTLKLLNTSFLLTLILKQIIFNLAIVR